MFNIHMHILAGFTNMQATLDWLLDQQATGAIASELSSLVIMGCSAGSIGAQVWASQILQTVKWQKVRIMLNTIKAVLSFNISGIMLLGCSRPG